MSKDWFIYVLKLKGDGLNDRYYIGKTDTPKIRFDEHFNKQGSAWTKINDPVDYHELTPDCDDFDEDKITIKYMAKYGKENVRGGTFCWPKLIKSTNDFIDKMINSSQNRCGICKQKGHFANICPDNPKRDSYCSRCHGVNHSLKQCNAK